MHTSTHLLSGWCIGNLVHINSRERLFCMIAATAQDLDGLGIIFGQKYYWDWHHVLLHNLTAAVLLSCGLALWSRQRLKCGLLYLALFHLHLLMDYVGSGELWTIHYLYPFSNLELMWTHAWPLFSWQNITTGFALIGWTIWIAAVKKRTPLEIIMPNLDRQLVEKAVTLSDRLRRVCRRTAD